MEQKNEVEVVIGGEVYRLMATESEEYIQKLASYINKKISEIYKSQSSPTVSGYLRTLFISINIADEFYKEQEKCEKLIEENSSNLLEIKTVKADNQKLQNEIVKLKAENENYLDKIKNPDLLNEENVKEIKKLKDENYAYFAEMTKLESENHLLKQCIKALKNQLELSQQELKEYIETFS